MKTIHKYQLQITDRQVIQMPVGAEILSVQWQRNQLCAWALVEKYETVHAPRVLHVVGTGHPVADGLEFLGTIQTHGGDLVWHVFEQVTE